MSKTKLKIANILERSAEPSSQLLQTNWELCVFCQKNINEVVQCPGNSIKPNAGVGYTTLAEDLLEFREVGELPSSLNWERLDDGLGVETTLRSNNAVWHKSCRAAYNKTKLNRMVKRKETPKTNIEETAPLSKRTRSSLPLLSPLREPNVCFFCDEESEIDTLHKTKTSGIDTRVRNAALALGDAKLLGKLSEGDMHAIEAKYHIKCLWSLYNRARSVKEKEVNSDDSAIHGIVFAELVSYIEESTQEEDTIPVFKLAELTKLYNTRFQQLSAAKTQIHATRLKEKLIAYIPGLSAYNKGRGVLLTFTEGIGEAIAQACEVNNDSDAMCLARAAQIVRRDMFQENENFNGTFSMNCQKNSVSQTLLALVRMILDGSNILNQSVTTDQQTSLSISQLLTFNSKRHEQKTTNTRHRQCQETPLPIYVGVVVHLLTRKKNLIDKLFHLGLCISYDRVLQISTDMGNSISEMFQNNAVVCPSNVRKGVFTTAAVDNIDHNMSSTTATESFHGTGISLFQHPNKAKDGIELSIVRILSSDAKKSIKEIPSFYTDIEPVSMKNTVPALPEALTISNVTTNLFENEMLEQQKWLQKVSSVVNEALSENEYITWASYYADSQENKDKKIVKCTSSLMPLFHEVAHSAAMLKHSMNVVKSAVTFLNSSQIPVIACDQPLFAILKQIQWTWPETHGEQNFVIMFGALHIEMDVLKAVGHWLQGSGWTDILVNAGVATSGVADSLLKATHVTRTRYAHQVTVAALDILLHKAYYKYELSAIQPAQSFDQWSKDSCTKSPHFQYWYLTREFQLTILIFIKSIREGNFSLYIESLEKLVPWLFALDFTHYSRWLPVHIKDMKELTVRHPTLAEEFYNGKFVVHKTNRAFSGMSIDQAHEQNNAKVKGDGGAIGLTQDPVALRRWMLAGPEMARLVDEFEDGLSGTNSESTLHHDQTKPKQLRFQKHVVSMVSVIEGLDNPFEETGSDLYVLTTKDITSSAVVKTVRQVKQLGTDNYNKFFEERVIKASTPLSDIIPKQKLPLFQSRHIEKTGDIKTKLASARCDAQLFSKLYIACQVREGDLDNFFSHENQSEPPSLSVAGRMRKCVKSDILQCLVTADSRVINRPDVTTLILDGAAIVQMLNPGTAKTFSDYSQHVFIPHVISQLQNVQRIDIIWDDYREDSLKDATREMRGKGIRRLVHPNTPVPKNWQSFLRDSRNKLELFSYLTQEVANIKTEDKVVVVTNGTNVLLYPSREDLSMLQPCSHEEADSRIFVHAADAVKMGHKKIMVRTTDSDVVVLAVAFCAFQETDIDIWISFGVGKNFCYIYANRVYDYIGHEKATAITFFHAFTGCDTVSSFAGRGKQTAWNVWKILPEVTAVFTALSNNPEEVSAEAMVLIERFVVLLYDRTSNCDRVNIARKSLFAKKNRTLEGIPPTEGALLLHTKRAALQGGVIWGQLTTPNPLYPDFTNWGWVLIDRKYQPLWSSLPQASAACYELIHCGCKVACNKRCNCNKANLRCTELCACDGACVPHDH